MKYLKIKNKGVLDIRLVALMGGTTKSNDEFKIGQFGTGLKYTLAYLVRNNIDFHIFAGEEKVDIKVETEVIRDEDFNIICINGARTSITDKMGLDWTAWMIIRELWCNALDEGQSERSLTEDLTGEVDSTSFYIQVTSEFKNVIDNWSKYFVHDVEPIYASKECAIYPGGDSLRIYKQGVLVKEVEGKKSLFAYDLKNATINEMRQYYGSVGYVIFKCLQHADEKTITYFIENLTPEHFEGADSMDYNWYQNFGETWKKAIGSAKLIHKEAVENIKARGVDMDLTGIVIVPKKLYEALTSQFEGIGALRVSAKIKEFYETYNSKLDEKIKQALVILEETEYNFSPELKFIYGVFGDKTVMAQVSLDKKEVYLSESLSTSSLFEIIHILIEENEHFKTGFSDHSREFQTHFIKLYAQQLLHNQKITL